MRHAALLGAAMFGLAAAHGDHSHANTVPEVDPNADWMTKHMAGLSPPLCPPSSPD
jgi:hypothetical protein